MPYYKNCVQILSYGYGISNYTYLTTRNKTVSSTHRFRKFILRVYINCINIEIITCISRSSEPPPPLCSYDAFICHTNIPGTILCNLWLHQRPTSSHSQTKPVVTDFASHQCIKKETLLSNNLQRRASWKKKEGKKKQT